MKKEIAEKWVKALRSGKYKQGRKALKKKDEFCCLGVLCDLSNLNTWETLIDSSFSYYFGNNAFLPSKVVKWAGMNSISGKLHAQKNNFINYSLSVANDEGATFNEIADLIELNWEKL